MTDREIFDPRANTNSSGGRAGGNKGKPGPRNSSHDRRVESGANPSEQVESGSDSGVSPGFGEISVQRPQGSGRAGVQGEAKGQKARAMLKARLGDEVYFSWFNALEIDSVDNGVVQASVPVIFLRKWIQEKFADELLACCKAEFKSAERVELVVRQPGPAQTTAAASHSVAATRWMKWNYCALAPRVYSAVCERWMAR